jgi:hypothetical protein
MYVYTYIYIYICTFIHIGKTAEGSAKEVGLHMAHLPGFWDLPAMKSTPPRLYVVDHDIFSRTGPRLVDGIELLVALIHPDLTEEFQPAGICICICMYICVCIFIVIYMYKYL